VDWRKSSYSGAQGGDCVETASADGMVMVRDTKDRGRGPVLRLTARAFTDFTSRIRVDAAR
jgi:hypothetical protein